MIKKSIIFTKSVARNFSDISISLNPFFGVNSFLLKNLDNSTYKLGINNSDFLNKNSGLTQSINTTINDSELNLKVQESLVTEIESSFFINDNFNIFQGLFNLRKLLCINCFFDGNINSLNDSLSFLSLSGGGVNSFDLNEVPENIRHLEISGQFEINNYTRRNWVNGITRISLENQKDVGLIQQEVDNLLEDLSETQLGANAVIRILGVNSPPSSSAQPFIDSMVQSQFAVVQTN
jgi:hypothetical protein